MAYNELVGGIKSYRQGDASTSLKKLLNANRCYGALGAAYTFNEGASKKRSDERHAANRGDKERTIAFYREHGREYANQTAAVCAMIGLNWPNFMAKELSSINLYSLHSDSKKDCKTTMQSCTGYLWTGSKVKPENKFDLAMEWLANIEPD